MGTLHIPTDGPVITTIELTPIKVPFPSFVREAMQSAGGLGMMIPAEEEWLGGILSFAGSSPRTAPSVWENSSYGCPRPE